MSGPGRVDETEVDELSSGYQPTETVAFPAPRPHRQVHDVARRDVSQLLVDVARRVGGTLDLHRTLEHITQAVVDLLGYQVAVMNLVTAHGELEVVTVAGPAAVRQQLLGSRESLPRWQALLDGAQQLGSLRFVDHRAGRPPGTRDRFPELTVVDHRPAWHPEDALFAPLHAGDGSLLGVLSVDLPADGLRPDAHQRELLELLAVQASLALDHARLFAKLQRSEGSFQRTFEHSPVGMAIFGPDRRYLRANRAYCDFLQRAEADLLGHQPEEFTHADDQTLSTDVGDTVRLTGDDVSRVDKRYLLPDGRVVWGRLSLTPLAGPRGHLEVIAYLEDITESRAVVRELERRATTDTLTGLANRATFDHTLETLLLDPSAQVTVLFCDVDHFKSVNDTFGHAAGDELLRQIGRNVTGVLRAQDLAARLGGDEFVVLLTGGVTQAQAHSVAERIRQSTRRIASVQGHTIVTSISIGVAVRTPGVGSRELLGSADRALYESKRRGRDCIATAQEPDPILPVLAVRPRRAAPGVLTRHPAPRRSRVRPTQDPFTELVASALHEQRLQVDYQPVVELNAGRIIGVEALLRMRDRNGRVVMPDTFIPLAEATGDIHEFGSWILMEAARQTQIWKRQLPADADFCLGVNLSPRQVDDPHLLDRVDEALAASRLDPSALALELTERIPIGNSTAGRRNLHEIRDRGVHLACDDFGAGHAGPQQIHELPFDIIKIDRMWTSRLALEDGPPTRLARGILRLAKATELVVIAEGVETERERLALLAEGCQLAQGYLFSRPQAPADITAYLRAQGGSDTGPRDEIGGSALAP